MNDQPEYEVKFGKYARTIDYADAQSKFLFTFDASTKGLKGWIVLEHHTGQTLRDPRYLMAFERTKRYLESCGYQVEVWGDPSPDKIRTEPKVPTIVIQDIQGMMIFRFTLDPNKDPTTGKLVLEFGQCGELPRDFDPQKMRKLLQEPSQVGEVLKDIRIVASETPERHARFAAARESAKKSVISMGYLVR